ncbi:MAG: lytic transglycosylase domain-containing protein [Aquificaceae bacterium]|nr:lytic transglycosylase domain-containing protein [Aquificaceae bacterium]
MLILLLLLPFLIAKAQPPEEYQLLIKYKQTKDIDIAYRILKEYPQAVFRDDLMLMLAKEETARGKKEEAKRLLLNSNPNNLLDNLKEDYVNLWKGLGLDQRTGFLKSPVLFREFIPNVKINQEEALKASEELFRKRYYRDAASLLERFDFQSVCFLLGKSYLFMKDRERSLAVLERCEDQRAKAELALMQFDMGNKERVENLLLEIKDKEVLYDALFRLGRKSLSTRKPEDAINYLQRIETSYGREFNLGIAYYAMGNYSKASEHFLNSVAYSKNAEERSSGYFWAYKSYMNIDREKASEYLVKASNGSGFYQAVASSMLGLPVASKAMKAVMEDENLPKTARLIKAVWNLGFPEYARLEAFKRIREMSSSDIISLSKFDPYLAVRLAIRKYGYGSFVYSAVAFPKPYLGLVEKISQKYNIEQALIYAIMRQESLFDPYAVSVANARGLMQLIDSTAQYMARREGIRIKNIYDPETNLLLGASYVRYLLDQWKGNLINTLASYNAGPSRVKSWQGYEDEHLFIETIPITETREYVKRVLYNYYVYSELLK